MKLYLDTADRSAAESLLATGLFAGVTTNPTILQRASKGVADLGDIYRWASGVRDLTSYRKDCAWHGTIRYDQMIS